MDTPRYTVTVSNSRRGWSYQAVHGTAPDPEVDDVYLTTPLGYTWAFVDELIPGQLEPCTATVNLVARTVELVPEVDDGDLVTITVRAGTAGPFIIAPPPMRVSSSVVDVDVLDPDLDPYAATLRINLVDIAAALRSLHPHVIGMENGAHGLARAWWRPRLAEVAVTIGRSLGCPVYPWADDEGPQWPDSPQNLSLSDPPDDWTGTAFDVLTELMNSHQPAGLTHTITPVYASGWPAGYRRVGPDVAWGPFGGDVPLAEPDTLERYVFTPASRRNPPTELPLTIEPADFSVIPNPTAPTGHARIAVDAGWCVLPTRARRSREHNINAVHMTGQIAVANQPADGFYHHELGTLDFVDGADVFDRGLNSRSVPTQLNLNYPTGALSQPPAPAIVAGVFIGDGSTRQAPWAFDGFRLVSSAVPPELVDDLLPAIAPRFPQEVDGDGMVVRHVTVFNLAGNARFRGQPMVGFITGGTMTVDEGDIIWELTTTPGLPQWTGPAPAPVLVQDAIDDPFGDLTLDDVGTRSRVGDLTYTSAP